MLPRCSLRNHCLFAERCTRSGPVPGDDVPGRLVGGRRCDSGAVPKERWGVLHDAERREADGREGKHVAAERILLHREPRRARRADLREFAPQVLRGGQHTAEA